MRWSNGWSWRYWAGAGTFAISPRCSKAGATLTVVISDNNPITQVVTINSNGDWSYSVTQSLVDGQHTITLTELGTDSVTRTASSVFTIQQGAPPTSGNETPLIILLITAGSLMLLGVPGMLRAFQRE